MSLSLLPLEFSPKAARGTVYIAGPCSAESREQVLNTALQLLKAGVHAFRAGVWKPRTRPGSFEGMGEKALAWLQEVQETTGMVVLTEIAQPSHLEQALEHGLRNFWIGARTTVNPFMVQELADAVAGMDLSILVKNPVNPDLELWIGALERFNRAGIKKLGAVHRGFSSFEKTVYRNEPNWQIPIELKRRFPELPLFCDPSHICGFSGLIPDTAQTALNLHFDGLMLEVHPNPEEALSDAAQQLRPDVFHHLMNTLVARRYQSENQSVNDSLTDLRKAIDEIDVRIVEALAERMRHIEAIGEFKQMHDLSIYQPERWNQVLQSVLEQSKALGLDPKFTERLFQSVHQHSIEVQNRVFRDSFNAETTE